MVTYNRDIPDGPNNPSRDQPLMKTNTNSVDDILKVDHVSFNTANSGFHKQVTFNAKTTQGAQTDPQSVVFTNDGVANTAHPQLYFKNSQATFPLSSIRAFGSFVSTNNAIIAPGLGSFLNFYNIASFSHTLNTTVYTITLTTNAVNTDNVIVLTTISTNTALTYQFSAGVLTLTTSAIGPIVNFLILQI